MSALGAAARRFWFAPASPAMMVAVRVAVCLYLLRVTLPVDVGRLARVSARPLEFMEPSPVLALLPLPFPLPGGAISAFGAVMALLCVLGAVGLATRPALFLLAVGYLYMGAAISAWGYVTHSRILPLQALLVLAFAPGTTAYSVDRLIGWLRRTGPRPTLRAVMRGTPVPRWGSQLILVVFAAVMMSAGVSKLRYTGWDWADGRTLGFYLTNGAVTNMLAHVPEGVERPDRWTDGFTQFVARRGTSPEQAWKDGIGLESYVYVARAQPLGAWVARSAPALAALSLLTLLVELAAPLVLLGRRVRDGYLLIACAFFVGIGLTMGISFMPWVVVLLCLVDWPGLVRPAAVLARGRVPRLRRLTGRPAAELP